METSYIYHVLAKAFGAKPHEGDYKALVIDSDTLKPVDLPDEEWGVTDNVYYLMYQYIYSIRYGNFSEIHILDAKMDTLFCVGEYEVEEGDKIVEEYEAYTTTTDNEFIERFVKAL